MTTQQEPKKIGSKEFDKLVDQLKSLSNPANFPRSKESDSSRVKPVKQAPVKQRASSPKTPSKPASSPKKVEPTQSPPTGEGDKVSPVSVPAPELKTPLEQEEEITQSRLNEAKKDLAVSKAKEQEIKTAGLEKQAKDAGITVGPGISDGDVSQATVNTEAQRVFGPHRRQEVPSPGAAFANELQRIATKNGASLTNQEINAVLDRLDAKARRDRANDPMGAVNQIFRHRITAKSALIDKDKAEIEDIIGKEGSAGSIGEGAVNLITSPLRFLGITPDFTSGSRKAFLQRRVAENERQLLALAGITLPSGSKERGLDRRHSLDRFLKDAQADKAIQQRLAVMGAQAVLKDRTDEVAHDRAKGIRGETAELEKEREKLRGNFRIQVAEIGARGAAGARAGADVPKLTAKQIEATEQGYASFASGVSKLLPNFDGPRGVVANALVKLYSNHIDKPRDKVTGELIKLDIPMLARDVLNSLSDAGLASTAMTAVSGAIVQMKDLLTSQQRLEEESTFRQGAIDNVWKKGNLLLNEIKEQAKTHGQEVEVEGGVRRITSLTQSEMNAEWLTAMELDIPGKSSAEAVEIYTTGMVDKIHEFDNLAKIRRASELQVYRTGDKGKKLQGLARIRHSQLNRSEKIRRSGVVETGRLEGFIEQRVSALLSSAMSRLGVDTVKHKVTRSSFGRGRRSNFRRTATEKEVIAANRADPRGFFGKLFSASPSDLKGFRRGASGGFIKEIDRARVDKEVGVLKGLIGKTPEQILSAIERGVGEQVFSSIQFGSQDVADSQMAPALKKLGWTSIEALNKQLQKQIKEGLRPRSK